MTPRPRPRSAAEPGLAVDATRVLMAGARATAVLDAAGRTASADLAQRRAELIATHERALRQAALRAEHEAARDRDSARQLAASLAPGPAGAPWRGRLTPVAEPLAVATHVRVGQLDGPEPARSLPVLAPLVGTGNIVVQLNGDGLGLVHGLLVRAVRGTGAGRLALHGYDPRRRGLLPRARVATSAADLAGLLDRLTDDVVQASDRGRGSLQLVALLDYPAGITAAAAASLGALLRAGPAAGVSFVVHHDPTVSPPDGVEAAGLDQAADVFAVTGPTATWSRLPDLVVVLDPPPPAGEAAGLASIVDEAVEKVGRSGVDQAMTDYADYVRALAAIGRGPRSAVEASRPYADRHRAELDEVDRAAAGVSARYDTRRAEVAGQLAAARSALAGLDQADLLVGPRAPFTVDRATEADVDTAVALLRTAVTDLVRSASRAGPSPTSAVPSPVRSYSPPSSSRVGVLLVSVLAVLLGLAVAAFLAGRG